MLDVERMPQRIGIGRETETGVTDIEIDVSAWIRKWPGVKISAMHTPQGGSPYVLDTELQGDTLVWHVSDADTASAGEGQMEIIGTAEGVRKLSCVVGVVVTGRMPGTVGDAPEAAKPWADKVLAAAESVRSSAEEARESAGSAQAYAEAAQETADGVVTAEAERVQHEQARVQAEQARQEAEKAREEVLPSKLTEPSTGLEVGKYFRIAAIDENGHAVLEAVDIVDDTLTKNGYAADAQATGASVNQLKDDLADFKTAAERKYAVKTIMDIVATPHTQYYLGEQTDVAIVLPDTADVGQIISVSWYNGDTAATLSITGTMLDFDFTPSENSRSEINALWDGTYWSVLGNKMEVPCDAASA